MLVKQIDIVCRCCGEARGHIHTTSVYAPVSPRDCICPSCIADGSGAGKFDAMFSDGRPLADAGVPDQVIEEVTKRTPGYNSWQQGVWLSCCNDACEFHGDAPRLQTLRDDALARTLAQWEWKEQNWLRFIQQYQPGGNPAVYKFRCRHCGPSNMPWILPESPNRVVSGIIDEA